MANWFLSCFLWKCLEASVPPIILGIESLVLSVFGTTTSLTVNLTVVIRIARQNMGMKLRRLPNNSKSSHQKRLAYVKKRVDGFSMFQMIIIGTKIIIRLKKHISSDFRSGFYFGDFRLFWCLMTLKGRGSHHIPVIFQLWLVIPRYIPLYQFLCYVDLLIVISHHLCHIAIEHAPFTVDLPLKNGDVPFRYVTFSG